MFDFSIVVFLNATIIIPSVIGFIRFRNLPLFFKFLAILMIVGLFCEGVMATMALYKKNNHLVGHVGRNLEIILMSLFFIYQLKSSNEKRIIWIAFVGLSIFSIVYSVFSDTEKFNSLPMTLESMYFSALSSFFFYKKSLDPQPDVDISFYVVNGAILFYFSSNFLFFAFSNHFIKDHENLLMMANVHTIVNAISNIAFAAGLWIASKSSYTVA
jgi:hypothetical protein